MNSEDLLYNAVCVLAFGEGMHLVVRSVPLLKKRHKLICILLP
jgi:hypothetical protein